MTRRGPEQIKPAKAQAPKPKPQPARLEHLRVPPHSIDSEQALLGGLMLAEEAIEKVDFIEEADFYRQDHRLIYRAIIDLHERKMPCDAVTMGEWFESNGLSEMVGGASYVIQLANSTPSAANIAAYADIVKEKSRLRKLIDAGTKMASDAFDQKAEASRIASNASSEISILISDPRAGGLEHVNTAVRSWMQKLQKRYDEGEKLTGLETPYGKLNDLTQGLQEEFIVVAGRPSMGKALDVETPIPTPRGWTTMGALQAGDIIFGADGSPVNVIAATNVMHDRECFEITFSDGSAIVADAEHQWFTKTRAARRYGKPGSVVTTKQIFDSVRLETKDTRCNHTIQVCGAAECSQASLPIDPYVLGAWLGDGSSYHGQIHSDDFEVIDNIRSRGFDVIKHAAKFAYGIYGLKAKLRQAGLLQNKHIPSEYLRASISQRKDLLAGLLDTDGSIANGGTCARFEVTSEVLARGAHELILSLGYKCAITTKRVNGRRESSSTCYRLTFTPKEHVFQLSRKRNKQKISGSERTQHRTIVSVKPVSSRPVKCISVDAADRLYLAGSAWIPTHNTVLLENIGRYCAVNGNATAIFSLEMRKEAILQRGISSMTGIPHERMRRAWQLTDDDFSNITQAMLRLNKAPYHIDDQPALTAKQIVARALRQHRRQPLKLVGIDNLSRIQLPGKANKADEIGDAIKILQEGGKKYGWCVVLLVHMNRPEKGRTDHRPTMNDLRGSGEIEQDADAILFLHREDYYTPNTHLRRVVELIPAKGRDLNLESLPRPQADMRSCVLLENHYSTMTLTDWVGDLPEPPAPAPRTTGKRSLKANAAPQSSMAYKDT